MTKKELKRWNEKHFQICLILLEQEAASSECMVNKLEMVNIISRALPSGVSNSSLARLIQQEPRPRE